MPRTISASEAKNRFGSVMDWATQHRDEVIVEVHGEPKVVVMPYQEYEEVNRLREDKRRQDLFKRLEALRSEVQAQNADLSEAEADRLAGEIRDEALTLAVQKRRAQGR